MLKETRYLNHNQVLKISPKDSFRPSIKISQNTEKKPTRKTMTKEEELNHIIAAKAGSRFSMKKLVTKYERFYHKMAKKYTFSTSIHTEADLVQEACMGLMKAVQTYNTDKRASFFTWAYYHVRGAITKVTRTELRQPIYPVSLEDSLRAYNVEDLSQTKEPEDELPMKILSDVCKGQNTLEYQLVLDKYGLGNNPKLTYKQCGQKYHMTYSKLKKKLREIEIKIKSALEKSGYKKEEIK